MTGDTYHPPSPVPLTPPVGEHAVSPTVKTANEFHLYLQGYDGGAARTLATLRDLIRAGVDGDVLAAVIVNMADARTEPSPDPPESTPWKVAE